MTTTTNKPQAIKVRTATGMVHYGFDLGSALTGARWKLACRKANAMSMHYVIPVDDSHEVTCSRCASKMAGK